MWPGDKPGHVVAVLALLDNQRQFRCSLSGDALMWRGLTSSDFLTLISIRCPVRNISS